MEPVDELRMLVCLEAQPPPWLAVSSMAWGEVMLIGSVAARLVPTSCPRTPTHLPCSALGAPGPVFSKTPRGFMPELSLRPGALSSEWQPPGAAPVRTEGVVGCRPQVEHHCGERLPKAALLPARPQLPAAGCGPTGRVLHWRCVRCALQRCPHGGGEVGRPPASSAAAWFPWGRGQCTTRASAPATGLSPAPTITAV